VRSWSRVLDTNPEPEAGARSWIKMLEQEIGSRSWRKNLKQK